MKKLLLVLIVAIMLSSVAVSAFAVGYGGTGIEVIASDTKLIKTGLLGKKLTFNDTDFKAALGIGDFYSVTITTLPEKSEGTLLLGGRMVSEGQVVRRRNVVCR